MSKLTNSIAALALATGCGAASALTYLDTAWEDTEVALTKIPPAYSFTHDLTDDPNNAFMSLADGYFPPDLVTELTLTLYFVDDGLYPGDTNYTIPGYTDPSEVGSVNPEGIANTFSTGEIAGLLAGGTSVSRTFDTGSVVGILTLAALTYDGKLGVVVSATSGDFYFAGSKLAAQGQTVPVPGALALLGIGALGLGLTMRRKAAK
jgi:hypothetical protein